LLDLSRLRSGVAEPHQELWTADDLVSRALDQLGPGGERVVTELDADAPPVQVDAAQIERVLVNLLDNALKFSPPETPVTLRVESRADELRLHVLDSGPGLDPAARESVFEAFQRGGEGVHGAGLGLAIARGFAEVNGARVWAENGGGGHFVLALPA
jgi:two-component system sensor histidine kinase KdpD